MEKKWYSRSSLFVCTKILGLGFLKTIVTSLLERGQMASQKWRSLNHVPQMCLGTS